MTTPDEPNKTRTIPLHIADQAVAACEAEIQKLKEENAQLKHKLGRLLGAQQEWTLVEPEHYARLKDKSACQTECLDAFDKKLREAEAKIERLLEAGDALYENQLEGMQIVGWEVEDCPLMMAWNAAKESKSV